MTSEQHPPSRLALSPADAAVAAGVGRTLLYEAISSGALASFKLGRRRLIRVAALEEWIRSAEASFRDAR